MDLGREWILSWCCLLLLGACSNSNGAGRTNDAGGGADSGGTTSANVDHSGGHSADVASGAFGGGGAGGMETLAGVDAGAGHSSGEDAYATGKGGSFPAGGSGGASSAEIDAGLGGSRLGGARSSSSSIGGASTSGCTAIVFQDLGRQDDPPLHCPVDTALPECSSKDEGALVARSTACIEATNAKYHCPALPSTVDFTVNELVVVIDSYGGCLWPIEVDSVLDCEGEERLTFHVHEPCDSCDWPMPSARLITIPNSGKPVKATGKLIRVGEEGPCI